MPPREDEAEDISSGLGGQIAYCVFSAVPLRPPELLSPPLSDKKAEVSVCLYHYLHELCMPN